MRNIVSCITTAAAMVAIISIIMSGSAYGLRFTEIMFNPNGTDTGREWIELHTNENDGCINLTAYRLFEEGTNHHIYAYDNSTSSTYGGDMSCGYAIICSDYAKFLLDYPNITSILGKNVTLYKSSFSLSNTGEYLAIKRDEDVIDEINYAYILDAMPISEGYSTEYLNDSWMQSSHTGGTPGYSDDDANVAAYNYTYYNITDNASNNNMTTNTTAITNSTADINISDTFENNTTNKSDENDDENYNETYSGNVSNSLPNSSDVSHECRASISIIIKNESSTYPSYPSIYDNDVSIKFYNKILLSNETNISINSLNYTIDYWIEDLAGNIVKNRVTTSNQDEKSFTPKVDESDKILVVKSIISSMTCNITNSSDQKIILIRNNNFSQAQSGTAGDCKPVKCTASKTEACACKSSAQGAQQSTLQDSGQNCSKVTAVKIITNCTARYQSGDVSSGIANIGNIDMSYGVSGISNTSISEFKTQNNLSNDSQGNGMLTGRIVYESPNQKSRVYALIGIIFLGLAIAGFCINKFCSSRKRQEKPQQKIIL